MNFPWTVVAMLAAGATSHVNIEKATTKKTEASSPKTHSIATPLTEALVKERLNNLGLSIETKTTEPVMTRIRQYITVGKKETEVVLGRTGMYFPVFEDILAQHGLPQELKYLAIIESGLQPKVRSHAGAAGIWQLMPISARHYGLSMAGGVDERLDLYRSTEAAAEMLQYLHSELGDWMLVLAAYNSGIGTIKKAVRAAGSKNYWKVAAHLPSETRRYVPAFLAAAYIANYHEQHGLKPVSPLHFAGDARAIRIYRSLAFGEISRVTGVKTSQLAALNPSFTGGVLPKSGKGNLLILPNGDASSLLRNYLESGKPLPQGTMRTAYVVSKGDNLEKIAALFNCTVEEIVKWNNIREGKIVFNQELMLILPKSFFIDRA
jgi:membrane-bound lytic murein transglycosylase D